MEAAFEGIVRRYYGKILKFCVYELGGNRSYAEDCTQDIFLVLYENMGRLKDYEKIGGWLYKTAGNISKRYIEVLRKERVRSAACSGGSGEWGLEGIASREMRAEGERIAEEEAIGRAAAGIEGRLKVEEKQILELAFRQGRPLKEVAARFNISLSAVKSRTSRLRRKIHVLARELLGD
jgi:RNA polymerase sigma-70 factor (ECF subfamily)